MNLVLFYHSLISDWNHGNAHFLRGIAREFISRGHQVTVCEPEDSWSVSHLLRQRGLQAIDDFKEAFPGLFPSVHRYDPENVDLAALIEGAHLVLVHEWNSPELIYKLGELRKSSRNGEKAPFQLLFHDTHHRMVTHPSEMDRYQLDHYDGVLAFGETLTRIYRERRKCRRVWTWHEAADTSLFFPRENSNKPFDLVWIGNWGDDERALELEEFLIRPLGDLCLRTRVYGVRYPKTALDRLAEAGIQYGNWVPNYQVPEIFSQAKLTIHVPRRPYVRALPGIPTIRMFEALASGIPLISAPWEDQEGLFSLGRDYLIAYDEEQMKNQISFLLNEPEAAHQQAQNGRTTILQRHTCAHRADELLQIYQELE